MKPIEHYFHEYGKFHRDPKNIRLHFIGIPLIMFAVIGLLDRVVIAENFAMNAPLTAAVLALAFANVFYLRLHKALGLILFAVSMAMYWASLKVSTLLHVAIFVIGWAVQLYGHKIEGKKPAFLQNTMHLLIGPIYIENEILKFVK